MATGCCWPSAGACPGAVSTALFISESPLAQALPAHPPIRSVPRGTPVQPMRCTLPEIEESEDEYPHQIDEVPIQARDLHGLIAALTVIKSRPDPAGYDSQVNHARRDVQAVETGDHEKTRSELRGSPRIAPRTDSFGDELGPFERLHANECGAESC